MFKVKNKVTYFGLEYDHDPVPNAVVIASARPQKIIKWVNSYKPVVMERDGKDVRRERTAVQCPMNFRLRKDEIHDAMKRNKLTSYQDGKFYVVLDHRMGQFEHPDTVKMKKAGLRKKVEDEKSKPNVGSVKPIPDEKSKSTKEDATLPIVEKVSGDQSVTPSNPPRPVGVGTPDSNPVAVQDGPVPDTGGVTSVTESGLEVTDRRRGAGDTDS